MKTIEEKRLTLYHCFDNMKNAVPVLVDIPEKIKENIEKTANKKDVSVGIFLSWKLSEYLKDQYSGG